LSNDEFDQLRQLLQAKIADGGGFGIAESGGFCLFAAEQFCRSHSSGAWKWDTILEPIGVWRVSSDVYYMVETGLRFWRRPLLRYCGWREFLVTLVCEGGLPLQVLHRQHAHLRHYFRQVLIAREQFVLLPTLEIVTRHDDVLPVTLRNEVVRRLAVDLIDAIVDLRREPAVRGAEDPVAALDSRGLKWRERIPLRIDEATAAELLRGLLKEEVEKVPRGLAIRMEVLLAGSGVRSVVRRIALTPVVEAATLALQFGCGADQLPARFQIDVTDDSGTRVGVALAMRRYGGGETYSLTSLASLSSALGLDWRSEPLMVASAGGVEFATASLPGVPPLDGLPWVFNAEESPPRCIGYGSARSQAAELIVLLGPDDRIEPPDFTDAPMTAATPMHRAVRVDRDAQVTTSVGTFRIRPRTEDESISEYVLRGASTRLGELGSFVWLGPPAVFEYQPGGAPRRVEDHRISWSHHGGRVSRTIRGAGPPIGSWVLRVAREGAVVFQTSVTIVPETLQCAVEPREDGVGGVVCLTGLGTARVEQVEPATGATVRVEERVRTTRLHIARTPEDRPPATVAVRIAWPGVGECRVQVPFPAVTEQFRRSDSDVLSDGALVVVGELSTVRARITRPSTLGRFLLEAQPVGKRAELLSPLPQRVDPGSRMACNVWELPLHAVCDRVSALVSSASELDSRVHIRMAADDGSTASGHASIWVGRYSHRLAQEPEPSGAAVVLRIANDDGTPAQSLPTGAVRICAKPLWALDRDSEELSGDVAGGWTFKVEGRESGAWVITGWVGDHPRIRPAVIDVGDRTAVPDRGPLDVAMHASVETRGAELEALVRAMGEQQGHPAWREFHDLLAEASQLPPGTFDAVRKLADVPSACCLVALHFHDRSWFPQFWDAMESLPFLWCAIPMRNWVDAMARRRSGLRERLIAGGFVEGGDELRAQTAALDDAFAASVKARAPFVEVMLFLLWNQLGDFAPLKSPIVADLSARRITTRRDAIFQGLLVRRADAVWPDERISSRWTSPAEVGAWAPDPEIRERTPVVYAPIVVAAANARGDLIDGPLMRQLHRLRAFDRTYFDEMHAVSLAHFIDRLLAKNPGAFRA
jgi:hypothetical protein